MNYANYIKLTFSIFLSFNHFFIIFFFTYIKKAKESSAKYYQNDKEKLQKKLVKGIKVFLKKKKEKCNNVVNDTKINQKMKKSLLSMDKNIIKLEKTPY